MKKAVDAETSLEPHLRSWQRDKAFASLQAEYPDLESALTKVQSAYDQYESQRTGFDDPED